MALQTKPYEIRRGRAEIEVPHRDSSLVFAYPHYGPGTYANVEEAIRQDDLSPPTMAETASLVYQAFLDEQKKEPEFSNIQDLMNQRWLWAFTGNLYVPNKGAYIQDRPLISNGLPVMDESELVARLEANSSDVRFVPFGFKTGEMAPAELAKNAYIVGLAGEEGAEKLAEVAGRHNKQRPYLCSFDSVDKLLTRVSALYSYWYVHRLNVGGGGLGDDRYGCAFGVREKTGEASAA